MLKSVFRNLARRSFKSLPLRAQIKVIRRNILLPQLCMSDEVEVKIADTKAELEGAYSLLHDCYVGKGLMSPDASGLRCNVYTFLPDTSTIIVKVKGELAGTVCLIKDSTFGLPSDSLYKQENEYLRQCQARLVEVSALAVSKKFRNNGNAISLLLMKHLYHHAKLMGGTHLVCTIHPDAESFYTALWGFKKNGKVKQYSFVNKALAIHMSMELSQAQAIECMHYFPSQELSRNPANWVLQQDDRFHFTQKDQFGALIPVMNPELIEYFFNRVSGIVKSLSKDQKLILYELYSIYFDPEKIRQLLKFEKFMIRRAHNRMNTAMKGQVSVNEKIYSIEIHNLSNTGAFVSTETLGLFRSGDRLKIALKIGEQSLRIESMIIWVNHGSASHLPRGMGIQFAKIQNIFLPIRSQKERRHTA